MNAAQDSLFDLLAAKATEGLSEESSRHLDRLLGEAPDVDPQSFERAAAAVHLALLGPEQPMPDALKRRVVTTGLRRLGQPSD